MNTKHQRPMVRIQRQTILVGDCKIFTGKTKTSNGYGQMRYKGKTEFVHRVVAHLYFGLDLNNPRQLALHKPECTSCACWNPEHLYVGTQKQNHRDRIQRRIMT